MAKSTNKVVDYLAYVALRVVVMFLRMFSMRANYRTARLVGDLVFRFDRVHRRRCLENLRASYPQWPEAECLRVARASLRSLAYLGLEVLFTTRLITPDRWREHIKLRGIDQALRALLDPDRGVIFITGHFGNFEVVGYTMATLGFPTVSVARPIDNPYVNDWLMGVRERTGQEILVKRGATRPASEILEARGAVNFIADQDAGRKGAFVEFFGRPASTFKMPALMAMQFQAPILVGYGLRLDESYHFEICVERIIRPGDWADKPDPMLWITQEYTRALENVIRRTPEQYLWVHRRWKHQPEAR